MWKVFSLEFNNRVEMPYTSKLLMQTDDKAAAFAFASGTKQYFWGRPQQANCVLVNPDGNVEGGW